LRGDAFVLPWIWIRFDSIWFDLISISFLTFYSALFRFSTAAAAAAASGRTSALKSFVYSSGNQKVLLSKGRRP